MELDWFDVILGVDDNLFPKFSDRWFFIERQKSLIPEK
jgi:hypothetical protein